MAKIATLITDMFEDVEYTDPSKAFNDAGHEVFTIEKEAGKEVTGKQGEAVVTIDKGIDEVSPMIMMPCSCQEDFLRTNCVPMIAL